MDDETPALLLVKSLQVQVYPPISHKCGASSGLITCDTFRPVFFEQLGDHLVWSCQRCRNIVSYQATVLIQNLRRREESLAQPLAQQQEYPFLMCLTEWQDRMGATVEGRRQTIDVIKAQLSSK